MDALDYAVFECVGLEYRQKGRRLSGRFPYGETATISDRGTVRKERFASRSFSFALEDPDRTISLLRGHDFNAALAVRSPKVKTLQLVDGDDALAFEATMPPLSMQATSMRDALLDVQNGLLAGISPGFRVPPRDVVPDAEDFTPEPGNPGVEIRVISKRCCLNCHSFTGLLTKRQAWNCAAIVPKKTRGAAVTNLQGGQ